MTIVLKKNGTGYAEIITNVDSITRVDNTTSSFAKNGKEYIILSDTIERIVINNE